MPVSITDMPHRDFLPYYICRPDVPMYVYTPLVPTPLKNTPWLSLAQNTCMHSLCRSVNKPCLSSECHSGMESFSEYNNW